MAGSRLALADGSPVELGALLARAGEGSIYEVVGRPDSVIKVFHPTLSDLPAKLDKVAAMAATPPRGAVQSDGFADVDASGTVYVADRWNDRVVSLARGAGEQRILAFSIGEPREIAVDSQGAAYATDDAGNTVISLSADGGTQTELLHARS